MGDPDKVLDVRIVIVPALTGKGDDGNEFYELIRRLGDSKLARALLQCSSPQAVERILKQ
jgi:mannitol/fructose-specific phosphotransferase system IIA component (Ntr-type)